MEKKRGILLKLSEEDIAFLEGQGGKTKAIKSLINNAKEEKEKQSKGIGDNFWDFVLIPADNHLCETYEAIVQIYVLNGHSGGTIDYFLPKLMGYTGFDEKTLIKHARKLGNAGYLSFDQLSFRPTLRLVESMKKEDFGSILSDFECFLRKEKMYVDFLDVEKKEIRNND